jgi:hypothetical protein
MHENDHQDRFRGFKLTNSMSFGESMFSAGFIQKTIKMDPIVRLNHVYPRWYRLGKTLEHSRRLSTEDGAHLSLALA